MRSYTHMVFYSSPVVWIETELWFSAYEKAYPSNEISIQSGLASDGTVVIERA